MPSYRAAVEVHYKPGVFDPAGQAVARSLSQLGHASVAVRVGKHLLLRFAAADEAAAGRAVEAMCRELLVNPVTETYRFRVEPDPDPEPVAPPSPGAGA